MDSKDTNLTPPNPTNATPLHGEGMDRLFQMQKDLGRLEAQSSNAEKRFDTLDKRLDAMDVKLTNIDKKLYAAGAIITLAVIIVPVVIRIYFS